MEGLYEGVLNKGNQPFYVRKLGIKNLEEILAVQEEVVRELKEQTTLQPLTFDEYQYILEGNGLMIGAFVGDSLIAFRALLVPKVDEDHLGWDIGLPAEELSKVIYQEISNVLPAYRGNQLQKTLANVIMKELAGEGHPYRYICCTVAPFNIPSLKDKFAQGMQIAALKEKYGGSLRYIFVKDLKASEPQQYKETITIPMDDIQQQQQKLAEGWRGIMLNGDINGDRHRSWTITYVCPSGVDI